MLFPQRLHEQIAHGSVTVAFRRWTRPSVRAGGTLRGPYGVLAIDEVARVDQDAITDTDARRAGEPDRDTLLRRLDRRDSGGELYRISFHHAGEDPRVALREQIPSQPQLAALLAELGAVDRRSRRGPWTREVLALIAEHPEVAATELADRLGWERLAFKRDVRRLKELGLTISCPTGYRVSRRGQAVLDAGAARSDR